MPHVKDLNFPDDIFAFQILHAGPISAVGSESSIALGRSQVRVPESSTFFRQLSFTGGRRIIENCLRAYD